MSRTKSYNLFILRPSAAENLVTNPSMRSTTGYTGESATISTVTTQARRGDTAMQIAANAGAAGGMRRTLTLTAGVKYYFSADILTNADDANLSYSWIIADNSGNALATVTMQGGQHLAGRWYRKSVSYTPASTASYRIRVVQSTATPARTFYTDGWLVVATSDSTYFDGDSVGYNRTVPDFWWTGTPHASTSKRSALAYTSGEPVSLRDYMSIHEILGAGLTTFIDAAVPSSKGGAWYQNTIPTASRALSINGVILGTDFGNLLANHAAIENLVNPMNQPEGQRQPVTLQYVPLDEYSNESGEVIELPVVYYSGLDGRFTNPAGEELVLVFTSYSPTWAASAESVVPLNLYTDLSSINYILQRNADGTWAAMGTGLTGGAPNSILHARDGRVYLGGPFTQAGGVSNTGRIAYWKAGAMHAMGTGAASGAVNKIIELPNGNIAVFGTFPAMGGVANTAYAAQWNGSAWSSFGIPNGEINDAFYFGNTLYVVGAFTQIGGAAISRIAQTSNSGTTWTGCGTPTSTTISRVVATRDSTMRAGGGAGAVYIKGSTTAPTAYIEAWNGATWSIIYTDPLDVLINYLTIDAQGRVYFIISRTSPSESGSLIQYTPGAGYVVVTSITSGQIKGAWELRDRSFMISTYTGIAGKITIEGVEYLDGYVNYKNNTWTAGEIRMLTTGGYVTAVSEPAAADGSMVIGVNITGTARVLGITAATIPMTGTSIFQTAPTYPVVKLTGPGKLVLLKNTRTGKTIYFNNLTLASGEIAWLNLDPVNIRFYSNLRPDLLGWVLQGSDLNWMLLPGENGIGFWMENTTAGSAAALIMRRNFSGIAGAGWE